MRRIHLTLAALLVVAAVALGACGGGGGSSASGNFCDLVKHYKNDKTLNSTPSNLADAKKQLQAVSTAIDKLAGAAPSAIDSEMQTLRRLADDLSTATQNATSESDFASKTQKFQSQSKAANAASSKVDAYAKQHCGTTLGSGG